MAALKILSRSAREGAGAVNLGAEFLCWRN
jgi:hypothetical protein